MNITYNNINGYQVPDLTLPPQPEGNLNRWGRARLQHLRSHKSLLHMNMLTQGLLWPHLSEMQQTAENRLELIIKQMAQAQGVTEELKASDQMQWLGLMNNIRHSAEESVMRELVYS